VRTSIKRWLFLAVALALPATVLHAARPPRRMMQDPSLAGQLLIASPELPAQFDAPSSCSRSTREGALGIVINRPGKMHPSPICSQPSAPTLGRARRYSDFLGSPVDPGIGCGAQREYQTDTLDIDGRVALRRAQKCCATSASARSAENLAAFGYAGRRRHARQQLAHGVWIIMPEDPALVFDDDRAKLWDDAVGNRAVTRSRCTAAASSVAFSSVGLRAIAALEGHNSGSAPIRVAAQSAWACCFGQSGVGLVRSVLMVLYSRSLSGRCANQPRRVGSEVGAVKSAIPARGAPFSPHAGEVR
jgi:putative AlgH/UPF0301 family transcriptional regulator